MAAVAFVLEDSYHNKDSDGEVDGHSSHNAWVFPHGLQVGYPAQYYAKARSYSGFPRYAAVDEDESVELASGIVVSIDSESVKFEWADTVRSANTAPWCKAGCPFATLLMKPLSEFEELGRRETRRRFADKRENYSITVPAEARELLPHWTRPAPTLLLMIHTCEVTDDTRRNVKLCSLNGDEFPVEVDDATTVEEALSLLGEQHGLAQHALDIVTADGVRLSEGEPLCGAHK